MLKDTALSSDFSLRALADVAVDMSGSDLKELCRNAAMVPVREYMREKGDDREAMERAQIEVYHCDNLPNVIECADM